MWRELARWIAARRTERLFRRLPPGYGTGVKPHPPLSTDQEQREHIEKQMEADSLHVGAPPPETPKNS